MSKFHLKGLDTLRAIAALSVLISHVEVFKENRHIEHARNIIPFFRYTGGHIGVVLFFVLSGFLISILLLKEKKRYSDIDLKAFYARRIFRVWPLYYFIIIISYLLTDFSPSSTTLVLCLSIFPNVAHAIGAAWSVSPQIWSIGVEEQFYLGWPMVVKHLKRPLLVFAAIASFFTLLPHVLLFALNRIHADPTIMELINKLSYGTKFQCLAIGGMAGVLHLQYQGRLKIHRLMSMTIISIPFIMWYCGFHTPQLMDELYGVLFAVSIFLITTQHQDGGSEPRILSGLGEISYGIYMYHWLVLIGIFKLDLVSSEKSLLFNIYVYSTAILGTIFISYLSFHFFEKRFLQIKERFSRV
ncbi:MAG: acyltransferase [Flavobacteriales bacterium]|nr:acyltransferase [Flavobacteriales bacterium]